MKDCVFCKIANNDIPCNKVWENENLLAFLDIKPAVPGMTLVIPKKHYQSYIVEQNPQITAEIMEAAKKVAKILDTKLDNVRRTKVVFEGLDIDHLHAKLYPIYQANLTPKLSLEEVASRFKC